MKALSGHLRSANLGPFQTVQNTCVHLSEIYLHQAQSYLLGTVAAHIAPPHACSYTIGSPDGSRTPDLQHRVERIQHRPWQFTIQSWNGGCDISFKQGLYPNKNIVQQN